LFQNLPHPWFITEDAHVNLLGVLDYIDQFTEPGDYVIVEDTNPIIPAVVGIGVFDDFKYVAWGREKLETVEEFMKKHPTRYRVDKEYTDFFG
jgi:cephalosporin hydroxylase